MTDIERLEERVKAVERTVVDGDFDLGELSGLDSLTEDLAELESRLDELEKRMAALESQTQSVDGYVSNVKRVNDDIEKRANAAVAAVDRLERRLDAFDSAGDHPGSSHGNTRPKQEQSDAPDSLADHRPGGEADGETDQLWEGDSTDGTTVQTDSDRASAEPENEKPHPSEPDFRSDPDRDSGTTGQRLAGAETTSSGGYRSEIHGKTYRQSVEELTDADGENSQI